MPRLPKNYSVLYCKKAKQYGSREFAATLVIEQMQADQASDLQVSRFIAWQCAEGEALLEQENSPEGRTESTGTREC
jgi:hypothetical protein